MLKITLASGQVQEVPFDQTSTLTITNQGFVDGVATPVTASFSEIAELAIVADPVPDQTVIQTEAPTPPPAPTGSVPVDTTAAGPEPTSSVVDDTLTPIQDDTITGIPAEVTTTDSGLAVVTGDFAPGTDSPVDGSGNPIDPAADVVVPADAPADVVPPDTSNPQVDALTDAGTPPDTVGGALAAADAGATPPATGDPGDETPEPTDTTVTDPPPGLEDAVASAGAVVDAAVTDPAAHIDHLAQAQTDIAAALQTWPDDANLLDLKQQLDDLAADAQEDAPGA